MLLSLLRFFALAKCRTWTVALNTAWAKPAVTVHKMYILHSHFSYHIVWLGKVSMLNFTFHNACRSQWPCGLMSGFVAARLLGLRVRVQLWAWMSVCCECCVVRQRSLRWADHSSRGVLPTVVRRCVWSRNLKNEEAMARVRPQCHKIIAMHYNCYKYW